MRQFLLGLIFLLMACASAWTQTTAAANRADPASTFGACTAGNSIIVANLCSGATLGIKVNAADAVLGSNPGEIWVYGGGAWGDENSRSTISSNHIIRLFPGTYTYTGYFGMIVLSNDSSLICEDPGNTILQEPTHAFIARTDMWVIVTAEGLAQTTPGSLIPHPNKNISVKGCRFTGARSDSSGAYGTIAMGNCHNCDVSGNVFTDTHAIGVYYGYPSTYKDDPLGLGVYAENSSLRNNLFINKHGMAMALTNGQNISIIDNKCIRPGAGLSFCVDIEPNTSTDRIVGVVIRNNFINLQGAGARGDGIAISNNAGVPALRYRGILVEHNYIDGAGASTTDYASRLLRIGIGIRHGAMDVLVRNNTLRFPYGSGIYTNNASRILIQGNSLFGGNNLIGFPIHLDASTSESVVSGNWLYCNLTQTDKCNTMIQNDGESSNVISGNLRSGVPTIAAGTGAGTSPTVSITGDDIQGYITVTTGTTPSASATVATITYANNHGNAPISVPLTPANANAAALSGTGQVFVDVSASSGASFVVNVGGTQLAARTNYRWFYGPVKQ